MHHERREDLESAIVALRNLRELLPSDVAGRDMLCDVLVAAQAYLEAIPLLRQRIDTTHSDERARLIRTLATILEERVDDEEGVFGVWA